VAQKPVSILVQGAQVQFSLYKKPLIMKKHYPLSIILLLFHLLQDLAMEIIAQNFPSGTSPP
jgi:hypothetical protein